MKTIGRPRGGKEVKAVCSIRLEPKVKASIIKKFGSLQKFIDNAIEKLK